MKYDSGMKQFHNDIIAALRYMLKDDSEITEKFGPGDGSPAPLRDYLKNRYGKLCASHIGDGMRYSCNAAKGLELTYDIILNNPGDKNLTLSWSQAAKFIRDNWDEVFKKSAPKPRPLETLVKTFDETEITCPHWERGKTLTYLEKVNGIHFECKAFLTEFCKFDDITKFFVQHCNCPEKCPYNKDAAEKQPSYIDKLRERYPKISETDDWFDGYYCPSELFDGDGVNDIDDEKCDYTTKGSEACPKCWRERCPANVEFLTDSYFEKEYFENYPEEGVPENTLEEKAAMKTGSEWELTHLCNKFGEDPCEYFMQTDNEKTVLNGKTLDICSYYCTSENKVRKIGSGGTWTGLSPKFCPKRRAAENKSICDDCINNDENCIKPSEDKCVGYTSESDTILNPAPESKPTYKDIFLEHYPNFDVSRFDEFAESLCVACCFDDGGAECPYGAFSGKCKKHWEDKCLFEWRDEIECDLETLKEFLIEQPSESETEEDNAETENQIIPHNAGKISETFNYAVLSSELGDFLKRKEQQLKNEYMNFTANCGAIFAEVQEKLAKDGHGTFIKWIEAMGFKKDTVYRMIDVNKFRLSLIAKDENGTQEIFDALPKYLQYDISKPSAPAELVEQVLNGDITTHKDYIKLKKELEEARSETETAKRDSEKNSEKLAAETAKADELQRNIEELNEKNTRLALEIVKLEKRPVDVIVDSSEVNKRVAEAVSKINSETEQTLAAREQEFAETLHFKDERIWALEDKLKELGGSTDADKKIFLLSMTDEDYRKMLAELGGSLRNILEAAAVVDIK